MAIKKRPKYMTILVAIVNGTVADTITPGNFTPDRDYGFVTGVRAFIAAAISGGTYVNLGLKDSKGDIAELSHMDGWIPSTAVPMSERWRDVLIPIDGSIIKALVQNPAAATGNYSIQFEFRLEDEFVKVANIN